MPHLRARAQGLSEKRSVNGGLHRLSRREARRSVPTRHVEDTRHRRPLRPLHSAGAPFRSYAAPQAATRARELYRHGSRCRCKL